MTAADTPLERRLRALLVAYPPRWRADRGDELVTTALDLARDGQRWPGPRLMADLLVGGWRARATDHVAHDGLLQAGWRLATTSAVLIQAAVAFVWLRDWILVGFQPLLPMLGGASTAVYLVSLVGFLLATATWLGGRARTTRWLAGIALACWLLASLVFATMSNNFVGGLESLVFDLGRPLIWTFLAVLATAGLRGPRPTAPRGVSAVAVLLLVGAGFTTTGAVAPSSATMLYYEHSPSLFTMLFDRSPDTLHTALRVGWAVLAIGGLGLARLDPRPVIAATWLLPFVLLSHLWFSGPVTAVAMIVAISAAVGVGLVVLHTTSPTGPHREA